MRIRPYLLAVALCLACGLAAAASTATPVNINTADAATLVEALDGVGRSKADTIVAWREAHGPFKTLQDLEQIKGIGPSILQRNKDAIEFGAGTANAGKASRRATGNTSKKQDKAAHQPAAHTRRNPVTSKLRSTPGPQR